MTHATTTTRIETLSRDNYDTWRIQAEAILIRNDTWGYVSGEIEQPVAKGAGDALAAAQAAAKAWLTNDRKAKADLILAINPSELAQIRGCNTSREVWLKLESVYASKGPARKATLLKRLAHAKMQEGEDVIKHLAEFFDAADKLRAMNIDIPDELLAIMLLYSLPASYENFRCAIESRENLPEAESLKVKIIEENNARIQTGKEDASAALFARGRSSSNKSNKFPQKTKGGAGGSKNNGNASDNPGQNKDTQSEVKRKYRCGYCNKRGHKENECWKKQKANANGGNQDKSDTVHWCCSVNNARESTNADDLWCLDSGCTSHLCGDKNAFTNASDKCGKLKLANNSETRVEGKGDVSIAIADSPDNVVTLKNTLYVPDLRSNLVSIAKIVDLDCEVTFSKSRAVVTDENGETEQSAHIAAEDKQTKTEIQELHTRLGHLNARDMSKLLLKGNATGLKLRAAINSITCESCISGKMSSTPFGARENFSSELLELIHTDVCGPMRTASTTGARYFITFIDDYSRVGHVYFLKSKAEAVDRFEEFKNLVENQLGRKIKRIQSDNGREYVNGKMANLLKASGIQHRLTVPHTPEQNGVAERKNRTLVEAARCMQLDAKLPPSLWAEAISTANYVRNRCPTKALPNGMTPHERWNGKKPNLSHLRSFGEKVFLLDKSPGKGKFDPKVTPGIFVGYSAESKAYRIWVPGERRIRTSRDVKFLNEFSPATPETSRQPEETIEGDGRTYREIVLDASVALLPIAPEVPVNHIEDPADENESDEFQPFHGFEAPEPPGEDGFDGDEEVRARGQTKRGRGRPQLVRTGRRGRPKRPCNQVLIDESDDSDQQELSASVRDPVPDERPVDERGRDSPAPDLVSGEDDVPECLADDQCIVMSAVEVPISDALESEDKEEWFDAIYSEAKCLVTNNTWELVDRPKDHKVIGCRTVLRNKFHPDGTLDRRKARVVARGFAQRSGVDFTETFAPVARLDSFRLLMALAAKFGLDIHQLDVTTAYLNGDIDTLVYMEPPVLLDETLKRVIHVETDKTLIAKAKKMLREFQSGDRVCKLFKALYGLKQAGRQWHVKLGNRMKSYGLFPTTSDPCVYVDERDETYALVYVDDILLLSRNPKRVEEIKQKLAADFQIKDLGNVRFCLGIEVEQTKDRITLCQRGYIREVLQKFGMAECKAARSPLAPGTRLELPTSTEGNAQLPYRELIGALMYIAIGTRPDISFAVNMLSQFNSKHDQTHWLAAKRILRYLQGTINMKLTYARDDKGILGYADADWGNCTIDRKSYAGYTFTLSGAAIAWSSRKQRIVALSSTEAEYVSLSEATREAIHLSSFVKELGVKKLSNITIFNDNQSAGKLVHNPIFHARTKHVDIKCHFIRQAIQIYPLKIEFLPTEEMTADILTKSLSGVKLENCIRGLGLQSC